MNSIFLRLAFTLIFVGACVQEFLARGVGIPSLSVEEIAEVIRFQVWRIERNHRSDSELTPKR